MSQKFAVLAVMMLCFAASASAQFEVSPDHFDEQSSSLVTQITPEQQNIQARIAAQKQILDSYYSQVRNKSQEVEAIWQDMLAHGTEAGQDLALSARQKELERLQQALAAEIRSAAVALAYLQEQEGTIARAQLKPVPPPATVQPVRMKHKQHPGTMLRASARAPQ